MKMLNPLSSLKVTNLEESVNQFFLLRETVRSVELDLSKIDAEMVLLGALVESFHANNPFEVGP